MFLDDQLYQKVKSFDIKESKDFQILVNELYKTCEAYFKPQLNDAMTYKANTQLMDRVFKLWDMTIHKLDKEDWWLIDILKDYPYKKEYLNHPVLKELYEKGK